MSPVKQSALTLPRTSPAKHASLFDLRAIGMQHAAPREDGRPLLRMRFDPSTGTLMPAA